MEIYIIRRLSLGLLILFVATLITFMLTQVVPSDPAKLWAGKFATEEQLEKAREKLGLNNPWPLRYFSYLRKTVQGDFGVSFRTHQPVAKELLSRLPASLELIIAGLGIGLIIGIFLGVLSAAKPNSVYDQIGRFLSVAGVALPQFWYAMILQLLLGKMLNILPVSSRLTLKYEFSGITGFYLIDSLIKGNFRIFTDSFLHLILPSVTLSAYVLGMSARLVRAKMIDILNQEYITSARAMGVSDLKVLLKYALRIAILPVLTMSATSFTYTLVGTFLVESIFSWPGIGSFTATAILSNDIPVILGVVLLVAASAVVFNLLADIAVALTDPRIRLE